MPHSLNLADDGSRGLDVHALKLLVAVGTKFPSSARRSVAHLGNWQSPG